MTARHTASSVIAGMVLLPSEGLVSVWGATSMKLPA